MQAAVATSGGGTSAVGVQDIGGIGGAGIDSGPGIISGPETGSGPGLVGTIPVQQGILVVQRTRLPLASHVCMLDASWVKTYEPCVMAMTLV